MVMGTVLSNLSTNTATPPCRDYVQVSVDVYCCSQCSVGDLCLVLVFLMQYLVSFLVSQSYAEEETASCFTSIVGLQSCG